MNKFFIHRSALFVSPIAVCALVVFLAGCTVGPNYKRPNTDAPTAYRGLTAEEAASASTQSLGEQKWWEVFQDEELQKLIRTALQQNYDARIAATHVLEAQAQVGLARANQLPTVSVSGTGTGLRNPATGPIPSYSFNFGRVTANAAWDVDFWGKYRRGTEAARANLLSTDWAREEVNATLVSNVAAAYFQLRELDLELDISQKALASRKESLELTKTLEEHGINSILDVRQAEQLVYTAAADIADLNRRIGQQEDSLSILLGNNPGPITPRGKELIDQPHRAGDSSRPSLRVAGTAPGHPRSGRVAGCGERPDRSRPGRLFSRYFADGAARIPELVAHQFVQRICRAVDVCGNDHAADF